MTRTLPIYTIGDKVFDFLERTFIMGILNVTPDSFSDGGKYVSIDKAIEHSLQMVADGADIIDIGGESTRPGALSVSVEEEIRRVIPVVEELASKIDVPISIDTYKAAVADAALKAGAKIVNDISGLSQDEKMLSVVSRAKATFVGMHIQGTPKNMQDKPQYNNILEDVNFYFNKIIKRAQSNSIQQIIIDPGIGFGKRLEHNLQLLKYLHKFIPLNYPILLGPSRKSFIGQILGGASPDERLEGTASIVALAIESGANIIRVHDVLQMKRVVQVADAILHTQKPFYMPTSTAPVPPPRNPNHPNSLSGPFVKEREAMIALLRRRGIKNETLLAIMGKVYRHLFIDEPFYPRAYEDSALPLLKNQTISQPYTVAIMTEMLRIKKGDKVLEIGTGSGYQAAILSELGARVFTVERHVELLNRARNILTKHGYNVASKCGDGSVGWSEFAPYESIIVTAAAKEVPEALIKQLIVGGNLVIPIGTEEEQDLHIITKLAAKNVTKIIPGFKFVPLIGKFGWNE
jgi:dihydropteroate synthase